MRRELVYITASGFIAAVLYSLFMDDWSDPAPIINAIVIGTLGGFIAGWMESKVFAAGQQRLSFTALILLRVVVYFIILSTLVVLVKARIDSWFKDLTFAEYLNGIEFQAFLSGEFKSILSYSFFIIALIIFFRQLSRYIGPGMLMNLIRGRYHSPKAEKRIFLLIDLQSSTTLAEQMDQVSYFEFLNRFFRDVSKAARQFKPSVYRYVGDQITFTWNESKVSADDVVYAYYAMKDQISLRSSTYSRDFDVVPKFRGTVHAGEVITGEIGDIRSQIVYQGSVLLEANLLEKVKDRPHDGLCGSSEFHSLLSEDRFKARIIENNFTLSFPVYEIYQ